MDSLELRFRPSGAGRWIEATFLSVWLLGWAAAEIIVLGLLGGGAWAWLQGRPLPGQPQALVAVLPVAAFLVVWLSFWTLGGVLALRQWLRCFWAEDRLTLTATDLEWRQRLGPWVRRRTLPRRAIQAVRLAQRRSDRSGPLIAQLEDRQLELTQLGTPEQRRQAAERLSEALENQAISPPAEERAALPREWECVKISFDCAVLVPNRRMRRRSGLAMALIALPVDAGWLLLLTQIGPRPDQLPLLLMLTLIATAASWSALWLGLGRREWRLDRGELVAQRRFAGRVTRLFAARALELRESSDEDGDLWYSLQATELRSLGARIGAPQVLCRSLHDPDEPRALGRWLMQRTGIAFRDQVPSEAERQAIRQEALEHLRTQLRSSGRLGRWVADRIEDRR